jgi:hypothetical protein
MSDKEVTTLEAVKEACDRFDSTQPVGYVAGKLAEQELAEQFSEDSDGQSEVNF